MTFSSRRRSRAAAHAVGIAATVAVVGIVEILIRAGVINPFIVPLPSLILASIPRIVTEEHVLQRFWQTTTEIAWAGLLLALVRHRDRRSPLQGAAAADGL